MIGVVNLAYLFAVSQSFMAWLIVWLYVKAAGRTELLSRLRVSLTFVVTNLLTDEEACSRITSERRGTRRAVS